MSGGQQPLSGHSAMGTSMSVKQSPVPYKMGDQGISETPLRRPLAPIKLGAFRRRRTALISEGVFRVTPIYGQEGGPTWPKFADVGAEGSRARYAAPEVVVLGLLPNPDAFPEFTQFHQRLIDDFSALEQNYGGGAIYDVAAIEDDNYIVVVVNTEQADIGADLEAYSQEAKQLFDTAMSMPLPTGAAPAVEAGDALPVPVQDAGQMLPAPVTDTQAGEPKKLPWLPILLGIGALGFAGWAIWSRSIR